MDAQAPEQSLREQDLEEGQIKTGITYVNRVLFVCVSLLGVWAAYVLITPQFLSSWVTGSPQEKSTSNIVSEDVIGFWDYLCVKGDAGYDECYAQQKISAKGTESELLVKIVAAKKAGRIYPRLKLIAPFGAFLPSGMMIDFSGESAFKVDYQFCIPEEQGCFINLDLEDDMVSVLSAVNAMRVQYAAQPNQMSDYDVHLYGIGDVIEKLKRNAYWPMR